MNESVQNSLLNCFLPLLFVVSADLLLIPVKNQWLRRDLYGFVFSNTYQVTILSNCIAVSWDYLIIKKQNFIVIDIAKTISHKEDYITIYMTRLLSHLILANVQLIQLSKSLKYP